MKAVSLKVLRVLTEREGMSKEMGRFLKDLAFKEMDAPAQYTAAYRDLIRQYAADWAEKNAH